MTPNKTTPKSRVTHDVALIVSGIAGLLGSLTMLTGDFLLYAHWGEMPAVAPVIHSLLSARQAILLATPEQLSLSSLLGPIAAALYVVGAWHVFARLHVASDLWAKIAGVLFATVTIMSGAYHAMWGQYGFALQLANHQATLAADLLGNTAGNMKLLNDVQTLLALPLLFIMLILVGSGKSHYPRWTVLFNPLLLYGIGTSLLTPLASDLPIPYGALLLGGLYNTVMAIFFLVSLLTLWNGKSATPSR